MMHYYARPEALVSTNWVAARLHDPKVRLVEADKDVLLYAAGHIPGAVKIDWQKDAHDRACRDAIDRSGFEHLVSSRGISNDTTVVFYGDKNNWYACHAFWQFKLYGRRDCRIMNGGRARWEAEGRSLAYGAPIYPRTPYTAEDADTSIRAFCYEVLREHRDDHDGHVVVDVSSPREYGGGVTTMRNYPQEGGRRGGYLPVARNVPWSGTINLDGTFKSPKELAALYASQGVTPDKGVLPYCRLGERSSHTWFVLSYLLGYQRVKNYSGSCMEQPAWCVYLLRLRIHAALPPMPSPPRPTERRGLVRYFAAHPPGGLL